MSTGAHCVLLAGGYLHPFAETGDALERMLTARGWSVDRYDTPEPAIARLAEDVQLFVINGLFWSMTQHEKYADDRAERAHELSNADLAAMFDHVRSGGTLLAIHTSVICWDKQPGWLDLLGGGWRWGRSHHPPMGQCEVALTDRGEAISKGPACFELVDEIYHALDPTDDCEILAHAIAAGQPQPIAWLRAEGEGLVGVDALGHDARSLEHPGHAGLLDGMLQELRTHSQPNGCQECRKD